MITHYTIKVNGLYYKGENPEATFAPSDGIGAGFHNPPKRYNYVIYGPTVYDKDGDPYLVCGYRGIEGAIRKINDDARARDVEITSIEITKVRENND